MPKRVTYYQRCKKWASTMVQSSQPTHQFVVKHLDTTWEARVWPWFSDNLVVAHGKRRDLACKRLWETFVEIGAAKEED